MTLSLAEDLNCPIVKNDVIVVGFFAGPIDPPIDIMSCYKTPGGVFEKSKQIVSLALL